MKLFETMNSQPWTLKMFVCILYIFVVSFWDCIHINKGLAFGHLVRSWPIHFESLSEKSGQTALSSLAKPPGSNNKTNGQQKGLTLVIHRCQQYGNYGSIVYWSVCILGFIRLCNKKTSNITICEYWSHHSEMALPLLTSWQKSEIFIDSMVFIVLECCRCSTLPLNIFKTRQMYRLPIKLFWEPSVSKPGRFISKQSIRQKGFPEVNAQALSATPHKTAVRSLVPSEVRLHIWMSPWLHVLLGIGLKHIGRSQVLP